MVEGYAGGQESALVGAIRHLDERAASLRSKLATIERARAALQQVVVSDVVADVASGDESIIAEIEKSKNQRAALKMIASRQGGRVRVRDAARLIERSSLTKGQLASIRATLLRYVKEHPDWVSEGDGYFALVSDDLETLVERAKPFVTVHEADGSFRKLTTLDDGEGDGSV